MRLSFEVIVAASRNRVMGVNGGLPWGMALKQDLARFSKLTRGHVVLMGRKTWDSLPVKPLPDRKHVIITSTPERYTTEYATDRETTRFCRIADFVDAVRALNPESKQCTIFVIGGRQILAHFIGYANTMHLTWVDTSIPIPIPLLNTSTTTTYTLLPRIPGRFTLTQYQQAPPEPGCPRYEFLTYTTTPTGADTPPNNETVYLDLLRDILTYGNARPDRTGTGTVGVFGRQLRFDLTALPILTTKFVAWKSCIRELLWFLRGSTDSRELSREGVRIWQGNSSRAFLDARGLGDLPEGDIGAGYGFQWRHFGAEYGTCEMEYAGQGVDQIEAVVKSLREDPFGRRHVVSAWNPTALSRMALPPCHVLFQFYVDSSASSSTSSSPSSSSSSSSHRLSCHLYQRSVDCFLGLPFNILSYAILTRIVAMRAGLAGVKELIISTGDTHIYSDHIPHVQEQLTRSPCPTPVLDIHPDVATLDWKDISIDHFTMHGYFHHEPIAAKMSV